MIIFNGIEVVTREEVEAQFNKYNIRHLKSVFNGALYSKEDVEKLKKSTTIQNLTTLKQRLNTYGPHLHKLSPRDQKIMMDYIEGIKVKKIMEKYKLSRQRLQQIKQNTINGYYDKK